MTDKKRYFYEFFMVVFCVLPVTSSAIVSGYLYRLTREKRNASACIGQNTDTSTFKTKVFIPYYFQFHLKLYLSPLRLFLLALTITFIDLFAIRPL